MKNNLKPTLTLSAICVAVALLLSVINMVTGPIIEAQRNAAASGALLVVMPDGNGFEEIDISTLGLPEAVTNVYKETSGKGYVFRVVSTGYKSGMVVMVGVDSDGKVTGSKCTESNETYGLEKLLNGQYNGKTLDDVDLIIAAGASQNSMTSKAYFTAVETALQANVVVGGGELSPEIVLKNMIPSIVPAYNKLKEAEVTSDKVVLALSTVNESGFAYIMVEGESYYLAIVNTMGACAIYNDAATDVTADHADLVTEAKTLASAAKQSYADTLNGKIETLMSGATEITEIELDCFTTVVSAASFKIESASYYAFFTRPLTYDDNPMTIITILDENGAIAHQSIKQMAFGHGVEYIPGIKDYVDANSQAYKDYLNKFNGINEDALTDDVLIAGATLSSSAVKLATSDAFNAFNSIKGGEQ